nr:uncharacterized protein LOC109751667 [Aegilops tauschii subsp. strangulata]
MPPPRSRLHCPRLRDTSPLSSHLRSVQRVSLLLSFLPAPTSLRGAPLAASNLTFPLLHPCTAAPSCCAHPQARSLDRNCWIGSVLLLRRGHCAAHALANNTVSGFVSQYSRRPAPLGFHCAAGLLHSSSTAPLAPGSHPPPTTIHQGTTLQARPPDAPSSCLLPVKRPTVSLLPHPSRGSWEAPEQSAHLLATVMDTAVALPIALGAATADDLSPMPPSSISLQPGVYTAVGSRPSRALTAVQVGLRPPSNVSYSVCLIPNRKYDSLYVFHFLPITQNMHCRMKMRRYTKRKCVVALSVFSI